MSPINHVKQKLITLRNPLLSVHLNNFDINLLDINLHCKPHRLDCW